MSNLVVLLPDRSTSLYVAARETIISQSLTNHNIFLTRRQSYSSSRFNFSHMGLHPHELESNVIDRDAVPTLSEHGLALLPLRI